MKKKIFTAGAIAVAFCAVFVYCYATNSSDRAVSDAKTQTTNSVSGGKGKVLVTYFTVPETDGVDAVAGASRVIVDGELSGNTEYIAQVIQQATGGDIFVIKTVQQYPGTHKKLIDFAQKEKETRARPKLVSHIENLSDYDVIFIGFPNWWYDMPMPLYTFFEEHDFKGKTIVPFCTHGGSSFSDAIETITNYEKRATILKGLAISRNNVAEAKPTVLSWLREIGMID